jgi:hypothetical protein
LASKRENRLKPTFWMIGKLSFGGASGMKWHNPEDGNFPFWEREDKMSNCEQ